MCTNLSIPGAPLSNIVYKVVPPRYKLVYKPHEYYGNIHKKKHRIHQGNRAPTERRIRD